MCIQCFPHTRCVVCATPTHTHTHRPQCSTHHNCSTLGSLFLLFFFLFSEKMAASDISQQPVTHLLRLPETEPRAIADGNVGSLRHPPLFLEVTAVPGVRRTHGTGGYLPPPPHRSEGWDSCGTPGRAALPPPPSPVKKKPHSNARKRRESAHEARQIGPAKVVAALPLGGGAGPFVSLSSAWFGVCYSGEAF